MAQIGWYDEDGVSEFDEEEGEGDEEGYEEVEAWDNPEVINVISKTTCWFARFLNLSHLFSFWLLIIL